MQTPNCRYSVNRSWSPRMRWQGPLLRGASALVLAILGVGIVAAHEAPSRVGPSEQHDALIKETPTHSSVIVPVARSPIATTAQPPVEERQRLLAGDRSLLAKALQRELQRVGCYNLEISGIWTTSSRMAMQTFLGQVNAALPTAEPDIILLSLVQAYEGAACTKSCLAGRSFAPSGECLPNTLLTTKFKPQEGVGAEAPNPIITGSLPASASAIRTAAEDRTPAPERKVSDRQPKQGRTSPPQSPWEPPKFVRNILKTVQRGIAQLGLP